MAFPLPKYNGGIDLFCDDRFDYMAICFPNLGKYMLVSPVHYEYLDNIFLNEKKAVIVHKKGWCSCMADEERGCEEIFSTVIPMYVKRDYITLRDVFNTMNEHWKDDMCCCDFLNYIETDGITIKLEFLNINED